MEESPSNAVLAEKINALKEIVIADRLSSSLKQTEILNQVTKTNGRVNSLEKWKNVATGAMLILTSVVVPVLVALAINYLSRK